MEIDFLNRNNTFKLQMTINRHNARPRLNYYGLPYHPHFSLPSTFKKCYSGIGIIIVSQLHHSVIGIAASGSVPYHWLPINPHIPSKSRGNVRSFSTYDLEVFSSSLSDDSNISLSTHGVQHYPKWILRFANQNLLLSIMKKFLNHREEGILCYESQS
jgi:hypothetical protein